MSVTVLSGIKRAITFTANFWTLIPLSVSKGTRIVCFRNGLTLKLVWTEYWALIHLFECLNEGSFTIKKMKDGYLIQKRKERFSFFASSLKDSSALLELTVRLVSQGWTFEQTDDMHLHFNKNEIACTVSVLNNNSFSVKFGESEIIGPFDCLCVYFLECAQGVYDCDFGNKVVLDVGGFCGETAVFFSSKGARKVIIYEPVPKHHEFIRRNIALNNIEAKVHEEGIGEKDATETISYESTNLKFGLTQKGQKKLKIKVKNVVDVIEESGAAIGKFDCEGAETSLLNVPKEILRMIDYYIIETHSVEIQKAIMDRFNRAGFRQVRDSIEVNENISMLYFERVPDVWNSQY